MLVVSVKTTQKGNLAKHIDKMFKAANGPKDVKVGFPAGAAPGDVIDIAFWNHYGTSRAKGDVFFRNGKVGISGPIPARPFIAMAMWRSRGEIRASMRQAAKSIFQGKYDMRTALEKLGMLGSNKIKDTITGGAFVPNSGMTVMLKGSSAPLIDNGRMLGAVTWKVVG